jgi:hypothetical protein
MILGGWEVDGTDSGSCPMVGFGISGAESSGSATTVSKLVTYTKLSYYGIQFLFEQ